MYNRYAMGKFKQTGCRGQIKLQVSLEVLLSMSVAMFIALYVVSSFIGAYHSYDKMHANESSFVCAAINLSNKISSQCSYCVSLARGEC